MPYRTVTDDDGNTHQLRIRKTEKGLYYVYEIYSDEGFNKSHEHELPEQAVAELTNDIINPNCAKSFESIPIELQEQISTFIHQNFHPGTRGKAKKYNSYHLKHIVEYAIGKYVSNGWLKGAMKKAGFIPHKDTRLSDINYIYVLEPLKSLDEKEWGWAATQPG